ncbi:MAG: tetratricopeptide repeat protein [Aureispira sp.]|nr:tetratricopeptide repeat protein [Aureispira sp.]
MQKVSILIVLTIGVLIGLSSFGYWNSTQASDLAYQYIQNANFDLYAHRAIVAPDVQLSIDEQIGRVDEHFNDGQKLEALALYQDILKQDPGNTEILLRMGVIHLQQEQPSEAQDYLLQAAENKISVFYLDAQWYLALIAIQNEASAKAKQLLQPIVDQRGNHYKDAELLLTKLH